MQGTFERSVLTLLPAQTAPLLYRRLGRHESVAQVVLCLGTCIERSVEKERRGFTDGSPDAETGGRGGAS
jgi:hypothetical protein